MGLFDFWSGSKSDPLGKLDPALKAYLEKQSPVKYHDQDRGTNPQRHPSSLETAERERRAAIEDAVRKEKERNEQVQRDREEKKKSGGSSWGSWGQTSTETTTEESSTSTEPGPEEGGETKPRTVPAASLFQDGRYSHLWKTYTPLLEVEAECKTDNEKLSDILDGYKERKRRIARTALENCAEEQMDWRLCMQEGGLRAKTTLCRHEVKKFEKCFYVQNRLLKALGYIEAFGRPLAFEEDIQMHAYDLYQKFLLQERAILAATKAGRPIPQFPPLVPRKQEDDDTYIATLPPNLQQQLQLRLAQHPEEDTSARAQELALFRREVREQGGVAKELQAHWVRQEKDRLKRVEEGKAGIFDKVMGAFGGGPGSRTKAWEEERDREVSRSMAEERERERERNR